MNKGFTLIELIVTIAIIAVLSAIILFSVTQYINKGKDSNISGNLAVLIPAGEVWYNGNSSSYNTPASFCNPNQNSVIQNIISQMPVNPAGSCYYNPYPADSSMWGTAGTGSGAGNPAGVCCAAASQAWVACAKELTTPANVYCVDSRAVKKEVVNGNCNTIISSCTSTICQCS